LSVARYEFPIEASAVPTHHWSPHPMPAMVTKEAPDFTADAVVNEEFHTVKLRDYRGKYVVLFFYPLNFTFVCPTEIIAFSDNIQDVKNRGVEGLGGSVDGKFGLPGWIRTRRTDGGLGGLKYPLVADITKQISADYGALLDGTGVPLRGPFLIDKHGILRHVLINGLPL